MSVCQCARLHPTGPWALPCVGRRPARGPLSSPPKATPKEDNTEREQDNHVDATDGEQPLYETAESGSLSRHSGVGFLIAPHIVQYIVDYNMHSDRIISLKLSVKGGLLHVVCHYAPHGGYDTSAKETHWELLNHIIEKFDKKTPKL